MQKHPDQSVANQNEPPQLDPKLLRRRGPSKGHLHPFVLAIATVVAMIALAGVIVVGFGATFERYFAEGGDLGGLGTAPHKPPGWSINMTGWYMLAFVVSLSVGVGTYVVLVRLLRSRQRHADRDQASSR